jgi:hypothetical protein
MPQFTVSVNVAVCCSDPDVAVTVTVDVTAVDPPPPPDGPPPEDPLPHAVRMLRVIRPTAKSAKSCRRRRFLRPMQQKAAANSASGNNGLDWRCRAAADAGAVTVSVVDVVPGGVTVAGEKLHDAPAGRPEQANETAESKPPTGVTETVIVPLLPAFKFNDTGDAAIEKVGGMV